ILIIGKTVFDHFVRMSILPPARGIEMKTRKEISIRIHCEKPKKKDIAVLSVETLYFVEQKNAINVKHL
ncbi:MAG: hypothetical protein ACFE8P_11630, partial [Promethearchaeota archaeon]